MTKEEKLQQLEFACESILEVMPEIGQGCEYCLFVDKDRHCSLNKSESAVLRDYCIKNIVDDILYEIKER